MSPVDKNTLIERALAEIGRRTVRRSFAVWSTAYVNDLPDDAFAVIEPGGKKDAEGKTVPRSKRHLPYKDKDGKIDIPHLRNALARLDQTDISAELKEQARRKLVAAAKKVGVEVGEGSKRAVGDSAWEHRDAELIRRAMELLARALQREKQETKLESHAADTDDLVAVALAKNAAKFICGEADQHK